MAVNYNRLWTLLIDKKMTRTELRKQAGLTTNVIANMGHDKDVSTEALAKICNTLNCTMDEILEVVPEQTNQRHEEK